MANYFRDQKRRNQSLHPRQEIGLVEKFCPLFSDFNCDYNLPTYQFSNDSRNHVTVVPNSRFDQ